MEQVLVTVVNVATVIYLICLIPAIIFTRDMIRRDMTIDDAPNKVLGCIFHFITAWAITPWFFVYLIITTIKGRKR